MQIELVNENEDGSGTFSLDLDQKEIEQLVGYAINTLLKAMLDTMEKEGYLEPSKES